MTAAQHHRAPQNRRARRTATGAASTPGTQTLLPPTLAPVLITQPDLLGYEPPARSTRLPFRSENVAPDFQVILPSEERVGLLAAPLLQGLIERGVTLDRPLTGKDTPISVLADLIRQEVGDLDLGLPVIGIDAVEEERGGGLRLSISQDNNWETETTALVTALTDLGQPDLLPSLLHHLGDVCSEHLRVYSVGSLEHDLHSLFDYEPIKYGKPGHEQPGYTNEEALDMYITAFTEKHDLSSHEEANLHPEFPAYLLGFSEWCCEMGMINAATAIIELPDCVLRGHYLSVSEIRKRLGALPAGLRQHLRKLVELFDHLRFVVATIPPATAFEQEAAHGQDRGETMPVLLVNQCVHVPLVTALINDAHENTMNIGMQEPFRTVCLRKPDDLQTAVQIIQGYARMASALRDVALRLDWAEQDAGNEALHLKSTPAPTLPPLQAFNGPIDAAALHFRWSVPHQEKTMTTPTTSLLQPTSALVVYRHPGLDTPVVINHPVHVDGVSAVLGAGTPVSQEAMEALMSSLETFSMSLQAENVLAQGKDAMVFWEKARSWRFSFDTKQPDVDRLSGRMIPMPALVFKVTGQRHMQVYALAENARPGPDTPLLAPPTMNTGQGHVCLGSTQLPDHIDPEHPEAWSEAYFRSTFTHSTNPMNWQSSYGDLLRLAIKRRRFPTEHLGKTVTTLRRLVGS